MQRLEFRHGRKPPRGLGNSERPRRSAFLITSQSTNAPNTPGGSGHADSTVILGKGGSLGGRRAEQDLGNLDSCKRKLHRRLLRRRERAQSGEHQSKLQLQLCSKGAGFRSSKFGDLMFLPPECDIVWSLRARSFLEA